MLRFEQLWIQIFVERFEAYFNIFTIILIQLLILMWGKTLIIALKNLRVYIQTRTSLGMDGALQGVFSKLVANRNTGKWY